MDNTLVVGACGFLGSHMCEVLSQAGLEVQGVDTPAACVRDDPQRGHFPSVVRGVGAALEPLVPSLDTWSALLEGVDTVFHTGLLRTPGLQRDLERVNVEGTRLLVEAAAHSKVRRVVLISSDVVYGQPGTHREDQTPNPVPGWPRSLLQAEQVLQGSQVEWVVMRPARIYGPRAGEKAHRGGTLLRLAKRRLSAAPRNLATQLPLVHVRDVCRAALHLAGETTAANGIFNISDGAGLSTRDCLRLVASLTGNAYLDLPPLPLGGLRTMARWTRASGLKALLGENPILDTQRLQAAGFELEYPDAHYGIRDTLTWYKQEGWLQ